jgi:hypothetical protein
MSFLVRQVCAGAAMADSEMKNASSNFETLFAVLIFHL